MQKTQPHHSTNLTEALTAGAQLLLLTTPILAFAWLLHAWLY